MLVILVLLYSCIWWFWAGFGVFECGLLFLMLFCADLLILRFGCSGFGFWLLGFGVFGVLGCRYMAPFWD